MSCCPDFFAPNSTETIDLLHSKRLVVVPKALVRFNPWLGERPVDTYGKKPLIDWSGRCAFAELAILWEFEAAGWQGRWIDSYRGKFRTGYWESDCIKELPAEQLHLFAKIRLAAGRRGGCFDVFCWSGDRVCFVEAKWTGKDRIRDSQRIWIEAAMDSGVRSDQLLVVEWAMA